MEIQEAKDFLVHQTEEQARIEGIPFSNLEKRMMYFTEGPEGVEDPVSLNQEFEARFNNAEYETKIVRLLHHAHRRLKRRESVKIGRWEAAIRKLKEGDHYLNVLLSALSGSAQRPLGIFGYVVMGTAILVLLAFAAMAYVRMNAQ